MYHRSQRIVGNASLSHHYLLTTPASNPTNSVCRLGYTARCPHGKLFGSPALEGGQAQYVRVPKAGSTLFNLDDPDTWPNRTPTNVADSSLLMLADILPTGVFAALQCLNHPKVQAVLTGRPWPLCILPSSSAVTADSVPLTKEDKILNVAIIGLGPVGICTTVSLLDMLATRGQPYRLVTVDLLESRRMKMGAVYAAIDQGGKGSGEFAVCSPEEAMIVVKEWTQEIGCTAVIEVGRMGLFKYPADIFCTRSLDITVLSLWHMNLLGHLESSLPLVYMLNVSCLLPDEICTTKMCLSISGGAMLGPCSRWRLNCLVSSIPHWHNLLISNFRIK